MDLSVPMVDDEQKNILDEFIEESKFPELNSKMFIQFIMRINLGGMIRNLDFG